MNQMGKGIKLILGIIAVVLAGTGGYVATSEKETTSPEPTTSAEPTSATASAKAKTTATSIPRTVSQQTKIALPSGISETCPLDSLPQEAAQVAEKIQAGARFSNEEDGSRFGNYEGRLPQEPLGYYREYTVDTPGARTRGARRIVTGGGSATDPQWWYYTDDHYDSFCLIPDAED